MKLPNTNPRRPDRRREHKKGLSSIFSLVLIVGLIMSLTIGGTLAFLQEPSNSVTNSFTLGSINYKLNLQPNAKQANQKYADTDVAMPSALTPVDSTNLSVVFAPSSEPALVGYTFGGWYYEADCDSIDQYPHVDTDGKITVKYGDTKDSNPDANKVEITLYADWSPINYTVEYKPNGGSGTMESSEHVYDVEKSLNANTFTRTGYRFLGWSTDASATEPEYTDAQSVTNLTDVDGSTVTLYAVWQKNEYTVTFIYNGGIGSPASTTVTYDMAYGTLPAPTRTGYTFNGWTLAETGTDYVTSTTIVATAGDHNLYAQWTPITYTVVYDKNGDDKAGITGSTANSMHTYDVAKNLTDNGYSRVGYTFIGWNTKADGSGASYANKESVTNLSATNCDTVRLYAQWGAKSYVIRFHANGGSGTMADQTIKYDVPTALSANKFTKADYSFMGWALTSNGEVKYIDEQTVLNVLESGTLDLYAIWAQDTHTVNFDYNGGSGSPTSKQFQNGHAYGQLPEYPVHPTVPQDGGYVLNYLFTGWYTAASGGTRVYPETIANTTSDHTLYAHWQPAPTNNVIQNMVVKNNPDDNHDGVVDDINLNFTCTSSFEKFNIPLNNLVPGQTYELTYTASNNASFGDYVNGYKNSVYGSYILKTSALTGGRIEQNYSESEYVAQVLANWESRTEPDGVNDGSQAATNDSLLRGPWRNQKITFVAQATTMYWTWDFGLMEDNIQNDYNITDIVLKPVVPKIEFNNKALKIYTTSQAQILNDTATDYTNNFVFDGDGYAETMYYPITGLTAGTTYTITFDHKMVGALINNSSYHYGCGISSVEPNKYGSYMDSVGATWISTTQPVFTNLNTTESVTLTFTATGSTAYWVWNMANCSDTTNCTIDIAVTKFSATHAGGGSITYHTATSKGKTLALMPAPAVPKISFNWEGIDSENLVWYPVDEQMPIAGNDYDLAFEVLEGYALPEIIKVTIDDVTYDVYTDGQEHRTLPEGETALPIAPRFNPETGILTIPAELLTEKTTTVAVSVIAVPVVTEPTDAAPTETSATEPTGVTSTEPTATDPTSAAPTDPASTEPAQDQPNALVALFTQIKDALTPTEPKATVAPTAAATTPPTAPATVPATEKEVTGE